jgi:hypothetical protein
MRVTLKSPSPIAVPHYARDPEILTLNAFSLGYTCKNSGKNYTRKRHKKNYHEDLGLGKISGSFS